MSSDDVIHNVTVDVGQTEVTAAIAVDEPHVVQAEQVEHRGMEVVQVDRSFDRLVTQFVGRTISQSGAYSPTCQPGGVTFGVVVTA